MLRSLYCCLLRLHPHGFRQRFAEEMLSIFDQAERKKAALSLIADGFLSLVRQWILRPEFWHDPSPALAQQTASDGIPTFYTLDPFRPRMAAVIHGLVLSAAIFCMTCFAIRYSWIHLLHIRIPEVEFESPRTIQPGYGSVTNPSFENPAPEHPAGQRRVVPAAELRSLLQPSLETILGAMAQQSGVIQSVTAPDSSEARKVSRFSSRILRAPAETSPQLSVYEGTYVVESTDRVTILITAENGHLAMSVAGQPGRALSRVSDTKFAVQGAGDCWIEFVRKSRTGRDAAISQLQLFVNGQQFVAQRQ